MPVPVPAAPEPETGEPAVIHQTRRGRLAGWASALVSSVVVLALLERAFGVNGPASAQLWIVPAGLVAAVASFRGYRRWLIPPRSESQLTVTPERLGYREGDNPPDEIERSRIGLITVVGSSLAGNYLITVHDHRSALITVWGPRWAGWKEDGCETDL
jgi:hypothetical protein